MAQEATLVFETEAPIPFTVADATAITKGTLLKMTDPMTAIVTSGTNDVIAGIASTDKIASDGVTKLGVYRRGVFKMTGSGSITVGDPVASVSGYPNHVASILNYLLVSGSKIVGTALETSTTGETLLVELDIQHGSG
jgi:hypothetical protein